MRLCFRSKLKEKDKASESLFVHVLLLQYQCPAQHRLLVQYHIAIIYSTRPRTTERSERGWMEDDR